ncbi:MALT1 [Acanthosepion pharaonis]|uniref:MALT1 n=1 Tax=Acanthosepion pharaonis TaxID=158019 RepID=A0A812DD23_ACAPH|nr:MALT1 [Sepia pharaonis]
MAYASMYEKLNENIRQIPLKLNLHMREILDCNYAVNGWQKFVDLLAGTKFMLSKNDIETCSELYTGHRSPTNAMITKLGSKNFLVVDLLRILNQLEQESLVEDVRNYVGLPPEPVTITQEPASSVRLEAGEDLVLVVEAQGFPYPRYQWFLGDNEIHGETTFQLIKKNVQVEDSGSYCCRLHNSPDRNEVKFTRPTVVNVRPSPVPVILQHTPPQTLFSQDTLILWCKATTFVDSNLIYEWYKEDTFIAFGPCHKKQKLTKIDSGEYKCLVRNDFGVTITEPILVNVLIETLEIVVQPKSTTVDLDSLALFTCKARGPEPLIYQWYKDEICIQGATSSEFDIIIKSLSDTGIYFCKVSCPSFQMECRSDFAILRIKDNSKQVQKKYAATDKVALLIGNEDYRSEKKLTAPQNDVEILSEIFMHLNFKVVSLVNLTLNEMESAIMKFIEMLDKGVYGVFYYAGHGFEVNGDPYSYLTPVDAPTGCNIKSCLQAEKIQELMASKKPALCCLILDICRTIQQSNVHQSRPIRTPENSVYFYATTRGNFAYEYAREKIGRLVKHLQKFLFLEEGIETVFGKVRGDIGSTNSDYFKQVAEMKTNLIEVERSLTDPINCTNHTVEFTRREIAWREAHTLPKSETFIISSINVELKVDFQHKFSNVLVIYVTIINPGNTTNCYAWAAKFPSVLSADKPCIVPDNSKKTKVVIRDLQKLKDPMEIVIKVVYEECTKQKNLEHRIKLGYPLVANQQLWKKCTVFSQNEPTEQECIESLDQISLE